jgi:PilZ domain
MGDVNQPDSFPAKGQPSSSERLRRAELRRHPRFRAEEAGARLYVKDFLATLGIGRKNEAGAAVNLSEGGVLLRIQSRLKGLSRVRVRIELEKYNDIIEAEGIVRWCFQSARNPADFYAGVEFRTLPQAQAALIGKMRSWFTSPEYKQKSAIRKRLAPPDLLR